MDDYPRDTAIRQDGPENWIGVTPFSDPCDGSLWYGVRRFDCWAVLVLALVLSAAAFGVAWLWQDARWGRRFDEVREFDGGTLGTDCWTDADGVTHEVHRWYAARDYDRILRYEAQFSCTLTTNAFRKVGLTGR